MDGLQWKTLLKWMIWGFPLDFSKFEWALCCLFLVAGFLIISRHICLALLASPGRTYVGVCDGTGVGGARHGALEMTKNGDKNVGKTS